VIGSKFGGGGSGAVDFPFIFHAQLTHFDPSGASIPVLVEAAPSLSDGSWRLLDDGQMETTYRLRPGLTWHDGTPFTVQDVVFTWRAIMNPALPAIDRMPEKHIEAVDTPDGQTLVVRWSRPYIFANAWDLQPIPRHILEPLVGDPHAFSNAAYWTTEWVGLGPYRLVEWVHGAQVKGEAFSRFALGAPKIQTVVLHIVADANQAVAQMLGGVIDVTLAGTIRPDEGVIIRDQLGARGEASLVTIPNKMRHGVYQFRDPSTPWARDVRVRRAMMHAIDRQEMADSLMQGYSRIADMYIAPADPTYPLADRVVRKYPYDPNRASALLAEAGWTRSGDGMVRTATGEQLDFEVRTSPDVQSNKEAQLLADWWKRVGLNTSIFIIPRTEQRNQEYRARFPGITTTSIASLEAFYYTSDTIPHEGNGWQGTNRGGYSSSEGDRLDHLYFTTIDATQRQQVLIDIVKLVSEELPYLAFYYNVDTHAVRTGLEGITSRWDRQPGMSYNIYAWRWTQ
jgi:peptide/nickel transport system substrate-binding protein